MGKGDLDIDARGLIREAYAMDLGPADCRSVLLDWALGHQGEAGRDAIAALLAFYEPRHRDHPMTAVLREGLAPAARPRRRADRPPRRDRRD